MEDRTILEQQARARSLFACVVERSRIVLLAADGKQDVPIAGLEKDATAWPSGGDPAYRWIGSSPRLDTQLPIFPTGIPGRSSASKTS